MCSGSKPKAPKAPKIPPLPPPPPPPPVPTVAQGGFAANVIRKTAFQRNVKRMAARGPSSLRIPLPKA